MITTTIDEIVRRYLLENGLPIHYYCEGLFHAATCLRELNFDTLKIVNAANLPVDAYGNVALPADFVEDVAICSPSGQSLTKLPRQSWITPLRLHDATTGAYQSYQDQVSTQSSTYLDYPIYAWAWFFNVDAFGTPTGGYYGGSGGTYTGYQVFKQQRRIQMTEDFINSNIVLLYISDGSSVDNASQIDPQAFSTINAFIEWKRSPQRNNDNSAEGRAFYNQRRLLRARLDPLDIATIKNTLYQNYTATIKN